jgi:uncharacterized membrane protein YfcA
MHTRSNVKRVSEKRFTHVHDSHLLKPNHDAAASHIISDDRSIDEGSIMLMRGIAANSAARFPRQRCLQRMVVALLVASMSFVASDEVIANQTFAPTHPRIKVIDEAGALPPLFPFQWEDYLGFGVAVIGLVLAAGGGIGGGGILVPTYILLMDFPAKNAIPLTSITVFGGTLANNLLNARQVHPDHPNRSVIDWELITQLEPMTMLGALIGAVLNNFLPDLVLVVTMVLLLTVTAYKTLEMAYKLNQVENEERLKNENSNQSETKPLQSKHISITEDDKQQGFKEHEIENSPRASLWAAGKLTGLFVVVTVLNLVKGGPGDLGDGPMGLQKCGPTCIWLVETATILVIFLFALQARRSLLWRIKRNIPIQSDIDWTRENTITYPCYAIVAGLVAGLFGVGGGLIEGPLMLALGVHPAITSATSACMILFTSSTATVSYIVFGLLVPDYAAFCLVVGFCSTIVGQAGMSLLLKRHNRNSYIAYSIGLVVAVSAVAMGIESAMELSK